MNKAVLSGLALVIVFLMFSPAGSPAAAQTVSPIDERLQTRVVEYDGATGKIKAYLALPKVRKGKLPAVIVIHENDGLRGYTEDIARRIALEGYIAIAPSALSTRKGGTPKDRRYARVAIWSLDRDATNKDFIGAIGFLRSMQEFDGNVGCLGSNWGGRLAIRLAAYSEDVKAAVSFYGGPLESEKVPKIKGALLLQYAGLDADIDKTVPEFTKDLDKAKIEYEIFTYPGVQHRFFNDTFPEKYNAAAAKLAWSRTIEFLNKELKSK